MMWPEEFELPPHRHQGRPCFEVLHYGELEVREIEAGRTGLGNYELETRRSHTVKDGDSAVVDPRKGDIHSVVAKKDSASVHVYPESYGECTIFQEAGNGSYSSEIVPLEVDRDVRNHL